MWPLLLAAVMMMPSQPQAPPGSPTKEEIQRYILQDSHCDDRESEAPPETRLSFGKIEYADLTGSGKPQAIVVAYTCNTGTAGADIHSVYTYGPDGKVLELPFDRAEEKKPLARTLPVFGNANYTLVAENGKLVAYWGDSSDREKPLIVRYKWDGKAFVVDSMEKTGPFRTSYDCGKASKEIERAICYSKAVAALDVKLAEIYRARLQSLPPEQRKSLQEEQRKWLVEREQNCVVYKWWVDCLTDLYNKRINALKP